MGSVETVRCLVIAENEILLLKKSADSKLPNHYELPGGKIEELSNDETQNLYLSIIKEVEEETGIKLSEKDLEKFNYFKKYSFELKGEHFERVVHYFIANLEQKPQVNVNLTQDSKGNLEDKHESYSWVKLETLSTFINSEKISSNSVDALSYLIEQNS